MDDSLVHLSTPDAGVTMIKLNRPEKRNAIDGPLIQALMTTLKKVAVDPETQVLLLAGNGEHFCAGADIGWMQKIALSSHKENREDATQLALLLYTLYIFPKPTIALTHGAALGGGLGLIAACDIAIAADDAHFCFTEAKMGLAPSVISPYIISAIGERATRYYFLTAEKFSASTANALGLIHVIAPSGSLLEQALTLAQMMLKNSPHALSEVKRLIAEVAPEKISAGLIDFTAEHLATMRSAPDAQEGLQSFLEKRNPQWKVNE